MATEEKERGLVWATEERERERKRRGLVWATEGREGGGWVRATEAVKEGSGGAGEQAGGDMVLQPRCLEQSGPALPPRLPQGRAPAVRGATSRRRRGSFGAVGQQFAGRAPAAATRGMTRQFYKARPLLMLRRATHPPLSGGGGLGGAGHDGGSSKARDGSESSRGDLGGGGGGGGDGGWGLGRSLADSLGRGSRASERPQL